MIYIASALAACFLAYSNGANDNFKGVTSLFGSKTTNYRTAISWGTITTFSGSITAIFIAQALLKKFSGKGLVPDAIVGSPQFLLAVAFGAALTVILATRIRISNLDHARNHGRDYRERAFGGAQRSQLRGARHWFRPASRAQSGAAIIVGALLYFIFHSVRLLFGVTKEWCVCIGCEERVVAQPQPSSVLAMRSVSPAMTLTVDEVRTLRWRVLRLTQPTVMDGAHFLSAGVVSFARDSMIRRRLSPCYSC